MIHRDPGASNFGDNGDGVNDIYEKGSEDDDDNALMVMMILMMMKSTQFQRWLMPKGAICMYLKSSLSYKL